MKVKTTYFGFLALTELNDFLGGGEKLGDSRPRRLGRRVFTHGFGSGTFDFVLAVTSLLMASSQ
jgi:hypothetical protein